MADEERVWQLEAAVVAVQAGMSDLVARVQADEVAADAADGVLMAVRAALRGAPGQPADVTRELEAPTVPDSRRESDRERRGE